MITVGLLGAGRIGQVHAPSIAGHAQSTLAAVSDFVPEAAARLAEKFGAEARSTEDIIADPAIDAVLIATSTDTHADLIEAATAAGKAVLCEKPVDLSLERARACAQVAAQNGQPVMVAFNRRFDPIPDTIHAVGSCVVDAAIGEAGDVDTAVATLTYADGRIAVIKNSRRASYGYDQRVEVLGSEGLLQAQNMLENTVVKSTGAGSVAAKPTYFFLERYAAAYVAEWDSFVAALEAKTPMPATLEDGVASLAMAEAATRSMQTGQPVRLADVLG